MTSPCWKCDRPWKCAECHSFCPVFMAWDESHRKNREAAYEEKRKTDEVYAQRTESVLKAYKKRGNVV